ncbi:hypothetical protein JNB_18818 [Janibacter sp. HTCC2649]|uniref:hypothetical protein n=1 Tax=Janibacter sp. HTCC2649 TaxID=313589 RepID=UPI0000670EFB|nr:hypothetical protein [Janibacter sp. HTCC2649]EAP97552.1 hypothetical protein JNB_18818 [Janibacter sp. HTCC2649]
MGDSLNYDRPGWFYVGNGTFRYWDGDIWTDEYRDGDDPAPPAPEYSGPKHESGKRRELPLWLVAFAVVLIVTAAAIAILIR